MGITIDEIVVSDPPEAWATSGFTVDDDAVCRIGSVRVRLVGRAEGTGLAGWSLREVPSGLRDLDGVATTASTAPPAAPAVHANGVTSIDHVVLLSPDVSRTVAALQGLGADPRRERAGELGGTAIRQVFFRFGEVILEVIGAPDTTAAGPASLWGLTHSVADLEATAALLGDGAGPVKDAVQPGRRITTLRHHELGMSVRTALISPAAR